MRVTSVITAALVLGFAFFVASKAPADSYGVAECAPAEAKPVAQTVNTEPTVLDEPPEPPFKRPNPNQKPREELNRMTTAELVKLSDNEMMTGINDQLQQRVDDEGLESLNAVEQNVLRAESLGYALNRGGFLMYFASPWGDYDATVKALQAVGSTEMLPLFQRSLQVFRGEKPPADQQQRLMILRGLVESQSEDVSPFAELDSAATLVTGGHADAVAKYARDHANELRVTGAQKPTP